MNHHPRLAVIATQPERLPYLEKAVASLRDQVDRIIVFGNGFTEDKDQEAVQKLNVEFRFCHRNMGSWAKLFWSDGWDGYYFACDDDLIYPPDYADRLSEVLDRWPGRPLFATACGRVLRPNAKAWGDWTEDSSVSYIDATEERWINYLGGCAFAFDSKLMWDGLTGARPMGPSPWVNEEADLSVFAQRNGIPIRLIGRPYDWPKRQELAPEIPTLWSQALTEGFASRSAIISKVKPWTVHTY